MKKTNVYNLKNLFSPTSIAVVGASREDKKIGHIVLKNIIEGGFAGSIFPINPNADEILGQKVYVNYATLPSVPDLAIICLPAELVILSVTEAAERGIKNFLIFSAGFKEMGSEGIARERELQAMAKKYKLAIIGPNCLGFVSPQAKLNATFGKVSLAPGNLRCIFQSGAIATSIFDWANSAEVNFKDFVTLGNKTVLGEVDILKHWEKTCATLTPAERDKQHAAGFSGYRPIGLYLESIVDGRAFIDVAKKITINDPMFILKPGKSTAARAAMMSHTGALAGDDAILDEALRESGIIRCRGVEDLFDMARASAWENAPNGPRVAIVSNAGGPAVMSADIIEEEGLSLAQLSANTGAILAKNLPPAANLANPVDVLGDALADRYVTAIKTVITDSAVDALLVILTPQIMTQISATAEAIVSLARQHNKPVFCSFMGGYDISAGEKILNQYKIPSFRYPERAIWVLGRMWWWQAWRTKQSNRLFDNFLSKNITTSESSIISRTALSPAKASEFLKKFGIVMPVSRVCRVMSEAEKFLTKHKTIVLKLSSDRVLHKSDAHGVITNIKTKIQLKKAWQKLATQVVKLHADKDLSAAILVQKEIEGGIEVIIGVKRDPSFGPVLMFGAGGIIVELLRDSNLHLFPISASEVEKLVQRSKIFPLLNGYRGRKKFALKKIYRLITRLCQLVAKSPKIMEVEINPVIVTEKEAIAVDGRILY